MSDVSQSLLSSDPARQERLEAVLADYLRRVEAGDSVDRQAILAEHADLADDLQEFFGNQERFQRIVGQPSWQGLAATADQQPSERLGTQIGPYKLLQEIGEGGMGVVYMAEQREPLQRRVALKIIKPGMDSREVIARFEAERQALAMMDHPGIAKVLDAGTTDGGRPFFVMELVKGIPITKYCDERQLTLRERLELMVPVCQAVQHAHQKGIVHRDIKPTNVLVAQYDGRPAPKVIDFGVAKAIAQKLTERTMFTQFGQVVGTLEYMSPEQAELNQLDIDTRSDIYSLGVLLYELLTGSTPFDRKRLRTAAFDEVLRIIREEEPPKPSTRISSSETLPSIAASRRVEPVRLGRMVRGELDWIVMKALDKDRARRYETANGLAMDIQRFLADEPVSACPPSAGYQLRKLIRRHKRGLVIAGLLAGLLLILAVGLPVEMLLRWERDAALLQKSRAEQAEKRAHAAEAEAKIRSHLARSADYRQRGQMGQRFKALDEIKQALRLDPSTELRNELRNEAIACLALADVRVAKEWDGFPRGSVYCAFDDALERYARTETSGAVTVRRVADDKEIYPIAAVNSGEPWPTLSPDGRYLAVNHYGDAQLKIWKLSGQVPAIVVERSNVRTGQFSPDSCRHATLNTDGTITLFDLTSGEQRKLAGSYRDASLIRFDPQGKRLAVACRTCVQVLDLSTESVAANFPLPPDYFPSVSWHPDGNTLATIGGDRVITIYDVASGKQTARLKGCKNGGLDCLFNHAGDMLLSHGWEQMLRLWDPRSGRQLLQTPALLDFPRFSTDDRFIAGERNGTRLRLLEVAKGNELHILTRAPVADDKIKDFLIGAVSPDGRLFACGMDDGVRLWDLVDGHQLALLPIGNTAGVAFEESESSAALLTNSRAGLFRWPIDADPALGVIRLGPRQTLPVAGGDNQIAASHNGAVTGVARYSEVAIVHRDRPDKLVRLAPVEDARYVAVSSSGRWVAAGSHGPGGAKVWDAHTGKLERDLPVGGLCRVAFSGDEKWLATASWTGCRLWRVGSWEEGPRIDGRCPCFSPDGRMLAVETGEGDVRLVDPETGRQYARLTNPHRDRANDICFSPDGSKLLTSSVDGDCVHVWDLRMIRKELAELSLDWDLPAYPPAKEQTKQKPLRVEVLSAAPAR